MSNHQHSSRSHGHDLRDGRRARRAESRRLQGALVVTAVFVVVEFAGGIISNSLALLADSGHMATDAAALGLSLWAVRLAGRPASPERTYGWVRMEVLAALVNGTAVLVMAGWIAWEGWGRLNAPTPIDAPVMLGVAAMGLAVNAWVALLLHPHIANNLNMRGAYLHVLGDLLGSIGALVAGIVILVTGWVAADAVVSFLIALLLVVAAWRLMSEATDVLLEAAPRHVDVVALARELAEVPGLSDVHDLHVWTLTSGFVALSGHGVIQDPISNSRVLDQIREVGRRWQIEHVTFQLESPRLVQLRPAGGDCAESSESRGSQRTRRRNSSP